MDDPLISIGKCAREIGLNKSTLSRQIKAGLIRSHDGSVRLSEVLEDRANNIDKSIWANRSKDKSEPSPAPLHATVPVAEVLHATPDDEEDDAPDDAEVIVDGEAMPLGKAKALKETDLARLRRLEFEVKSGRLVDADAAKKAVFDLSRQDRDSWTNWPSRVSPLIAAELGVDQVKLAVVLEKYVRDHLAERAQPALRLAS
jgi:hypothetical protein